MKEIEGVKLYTIEDVKSLLGVSRETVRNIAKRGELTPVRIGRMKYFSEKDLLGFLNADNSKTSSARAEDPCNTI